MVQQLSVFALLGICSYEDIKDKKIHTRWLLTFSVEGILLWFFWERCSIIEMLLAILPGLLLLFLAFITKGGIGEGDGMLLIVIGIFLGGAYAFKIFVYALFLSGSYALFLFIIRKKSRKYEMAFVPFLLLSFVGDILLRNY